MRAKPTDFSDAPIDGVGIGSIVELSDINSGEKQKYTILGAWDGDPDNNILSYLTPLGQKLLGKKVGDLVETEVENTVTNWKIEGVLRWVDSPVKSSVLYYCFCKGSKRSLPNRFSLLNSSSRD